jgi:hypothetical protein
VRTISPSAVCSLQPRRVDFLQFAVPNGRSVHRDAVPRHPDPISRNADHALEDWPETARAGAVDHAAALSRQTATHAARSTAGLTR